MNAEPMDTGERYRTRQELADRFRTAKAGELIPLRMLRAMLTKLPAAERLDTLVDLVQEHLHRSWETSAETPRLRPRESHSLSHSPIPNASRPRVPWP